MEKKIIVLHYDRNVDPNSIEKLIKEKYPHCVVKTTTTREEYSEALRTDVYDLIITESDQQHIFDVLSDFKFAKAVTPHSHFILLLPDKTDEEVKRNKHYKDIEKIPRAEINNLIPIVNRAFGEVYSKHDVSLHWG